MSYTATTANASDLITATPTDPNAEVSIESDDATIDEDGNAEWVAGTNDVTITVTNGDNETVYEAAVDYEPNTKLQTLTIGSATLTPTFSPDVLSYTVVTENQTDLVTATPADPNATVTVTSNTATVHEDGTVTWEGMEAANDLTIKVENGDDATEYTATVTWHIEAGLSSLTVGNLALTPPFETSVLDYAVTTQNATNKITAVGLTDRIGITIESEDATIDNDGTAHWADGVNEVTIETLSPSGDNTVYTVIVTKE